jgi:hypothetical protein
MNLLLSWKFISYDVTRRAIEANNLGVIKKALFSEVASLPNTGALASIIRTDNIAAFDILKEYYCALGRVVRDVVILELLGAGKVDMLCLMVATFCNNDPYGLSHVPVHDQNRKVHPNMVFNNAIVDHPAAQYLLHLKSDVLEQYIYELYIHGYFEIAIGLMLTAEFYDPRMCTKPKGNHKVWTRLGHSAFHERIINLGICDCKTKKKRKV